MLIYNYTLIDELSNEEHESLNHAPLGFCSHCNKLIYISYCIHEKFQCVLSPRYVGYWKYAIHGGKIIKDQKL
jgi:hypothetical protein